MMFSNSCGEIIDTVSDGIVSTSLLRTHNQKSNINRRDRIRYYCKCVMYHLPVATIWRVLNTSCGVDDTWRAACVLTVNGVSVFLSVAH